MKRADMTIGDLDAGGKLPPEVGTTDAPADFLEPALPKPKRATVAVLAPSQRRALLVEQRAGSGVMVALFLPADAAAALALPGGEAPSDLHLTLAYLGAAEEVADVSAVRDAAGAVARVSAKIAGVVSGIGRFSSSDPDGRDVAYASFDAPGLELLRASVVDALEEAGVPASTRHGFTPHVTLAYVEPGAEVALACPERLAITFEALTVAVGPTRTVHPLGEGPRARAVVLAPSQRAANG